MKTVSDRIQWFTKLTRLWGQLTHYYRCRCPQHAQTWIKNAVFSLYICVLRVPRGFQFRMVWVLRENWAHIMMITWPCHNHIICCFFCLRLLYFWISSISTDHPPKNVPSQRLGLLESMGRILPHLDWEWSHNHYRPCREFLNIKWCRNFCSSTLRILLEDVY